MISTPTAIIVASVIVGGSISAAIVESVRLSDHYEIATTTDGDTALGWRLNKQTGKLVICKVTRNDNPFANIDPSRAVDKIMVQCGYE